MHRDGHHRQYAGVREEAREASIARLLAVLTFVAFALHYRYGDVITDVVAFVPSLPFRHFGFPMLASAFLAVEPVALLVGLAGFVFCAAPLERRIGAAWLWALFLWGHVGGLALQAATAPAVPGYRTWGPNSGILAILFASAMLSPFFKKQHDEDFEVPLPPAPRAPWIWLTLYVVATLAIFALNQGASAGVSGAGSLAGMVVGIVGARTYRSGSSLGGGFQFATPAARVAVIVIALLAGAEHRQFLMEKMGRTKWEPQAVPPQTAGLEPAMPRAENEGPPVSEVAHGKLETFLAKEIGPRNLVFVTVDPSDRLIAYADNELWVDNQWYSAARLWDDEGFSAAAAGFTIRIRKPSRIDGSIAVLVNGAPIEAWPASRLTAARVRELAQKPPKSARISRSGVEIR